LSWCEFNTCNWKKFLNDHEKQELAAMVEDLEHDLDVVSGGVIHAELEKER
jgi:hypothetical protein